MPQVLLLMPAAWLSAVTLASAGRLGSHDDQGLAWAKAAVSVRHFGPMVDRLGLQSGNSRVRFHMDNFGISGARARRGRRHFDQSR